MLGFTKFVGIVTIAALVLLVVPILGEPRKKEINGKTLAQDALEHLLAKTAKSESQDHHGDRTSIKPQSHLNTNILTGSISGSASCRPPYVPAYGGSGYNGGGGGGGGGYGYGDPYSNNFPSGSYHGGYNPWPDYGSNHYPPWKSQYCQQCYYHCPYHSYPRTEPLEQKSPDGVSPNVPYKVKESVEVLERFSKANNDGSQEHKVVLSNGLTIFQKVYNKSNEKQQLQPIEGYYSQKLSDNSYLTTFHRSSEKGYFATSEVSSSPPDANDTKEPKTLTYKEDELPLVDDDKRI